MAIERTGEQTIVRLSGPWTAPHAEQVEILAGEIAAEADRFPLYLDLSGVERLDTLGAWTLDRARHELSARGQAAFAHASPEQKILLEEAAYRDFREEPKPRQSRAMDFLVDVGQSVAGAGKDLVGGVGFLGELVAALVRVVTHPRRFRGSAVINQLEQIAYRGVPIIVLISFLVGCIVSQQGIFQLVKFGATPFVIDLIGILVLRELGVLLTSIMVAGRSGSAFTAEIGSMKMREEIDALRVMGLDPIEVLIVPRILALIIGLPLLTFISSIAALVGGGLTTWVYGGISPDIFLERLRAAVGMNTFLVGLIKAPFMAVVIGIIATLEGLAVAGSAESLGRHVTSSVVKAIFMVIVLDGLFAMFFAAIRY
ncbi:ABC transporter permease [Microvirga arsenatis]|uniref:MlaE family lipid ABC transporter permease subunit n=1 Tax=Microvirga arsenatis TaxID=2692265 RepID=A0ABW9YW56_9HYPH|nr:MlaE family lipid ABC transporter permease subunit [Microvirga arsenatis]NBJ10804.1 MlaE family lipid ABC transporter permease subunit [Microvirga arsenatis]NBJ24298.1 MlaE family lipid ABC transporter permease subunit [Microvirga arsenatis]